MPPRPHLPVDDALPELISVLARGPAVVLEAPPGAGKSTRVPPALLAAGVGGGGLIAVLEPRRAAARMVARRLAAERGEAVGGVVGYSVRFETRRSAATRILVMTEGVLTRRFSADPFIEDVGCVVLDEFHERSVHVDLALAFLKELLEVREDLKVVVMSATLDAGGVAAWLGGCPVVRVPGRVHPLSIRHLGARDKWDPAGRVVDGVRALLADPGDDGGDILAFLPGAPEIHRAQRALAEARLPAALDAVPLYGALPAAEQDRALSQGPRRRVVLATNIAETSLTIEGVTAVVDTGLAKVLRHDPQRGLDRLEVAPISAASSVQRAGRAGRTAPGRVVRLWSEGEQRALADAELPEIRRVDLAPVLMRVLAVAPGDPAAFPFFEAPEPAALGAALDLLRSLGAVGAEGFALTPFGQRLAELPVHPRIGAVLSRAQALGIGDAGALAAALLGERDLLRRGSELPTTPSDLGWRVEVMRQLEGARFDEGAARRYGADAGAARAVARARDQLRVGRGPRPGREDRAPGPAAPAAGSSVAPAGGEDALLRRALLAGYPDRLCRRRRPGELDARMVGGSGGRLEPSSGVREAALFIALEVDAGRRGERSAARIHQASAVDEAWLALDFPEHLSEGVEAIFDPSTEAVVGQRVRRFMDLPIAEIRGAPVGDGEAARVLAEAAAAPGMWERAFRPDKAGWRLIQRLRLAARLMPDADWPDLGDEILRGWLPELAWGRRSFADLARIDWAAAVRARVPWDRLQALDVDIPDKLAVPSGSHIAIDYDAAFAGAGQPVLAVRLQEVFGLAETPTIARGRQPLLLHLLAPNHRPVQVTQDLRSFWDSTYAEVRKELRQRYPKHAWPEDPWTAEAVRGARRRR